MAQSAATISLVSRMAGGKLFADGQGGAILFKRAGEIALIAHRASEIIAGIGELKLEVLIGGLFPRQVQTEREGFPKMLQAVARPRRVSSSRKPSFWWLLARSRRACASAGVRPRRALRESATPSCNSRLLRMKSPRLPLDFSSAHVAHSLVSGGELALEFGVAVRFAGQTVEVSQTILDQSLPHFRRAGQVLDRVVIIEQDVIRQLAHVVETPLGSRLSPVVAICACQLVAMMPPIRARRTSAAAASAVLFRRTNFAAR